MMSLIDTQGVEESCTLSPKDCCTKLSVEQSAGHSDGTRHLVEKHQSLQNFATHVLQKISSSRGKLLDTFPGGGRKCGQFFTPERSGTNPLILSVSCRESRS